MDHPHQQLLDPSFGKLSPHAPPELAAFAFLISLDRFDVNPISFWLFFMCSPPLLIAGVLCRKSVRNYYARTAESNSPTN